MKFTIHGFSQEAALNLGLDNDDLLLLRWFVDFKDSGKMIHKIIDDKNYYWVNYQKVIEALPILCLKKDSIYRKFKKMADCGVLTRITVRVAGTFSFYAIGKNYELLIFNGNYNPPAKENFCKNSPLPNYANFESKNFPEVCVKNSTNSENFPTDSKKTPDQKISPSNYSKKINKNLVDTSVEYQLGVFLFSKIQELNPKFKTPNLVKWSKEFYKLLKIDNHSLKEIQQLIEWIFTPGNFWSCQILSPAKLRRKFDELIIRMDFDDKKFSKNSHTRFKAGSTKYDLAGFEVIE